jgi:C-terminal processing protease CtpA/Prc
LDDAFQKIGNQLRKVVKCMEAHSLACWNCTMQFFCFDCFEPTDFSNDGSCGVGLEILMDGGGSWHIVGIRPGGPADMARLSVGDQIVSIDFDSLNVSEISLCQ